MTAQKCFCCSKSIDIDEACFAVRMPLVVSTAYGSVPIAVFAHRKCGAQHGRDLTKEAVAYMLSTVVAATLSRAESVETTLNNWVGSPRSKDLPCRPHVAVVS